MEHRGSASPLPLIPWNAVRLPSLRWFAATAVTCAVLTGVMGSFYSSNGLASIFSPSSGVALAAVLLGGMELAAAVYVGVLAGQLWAGASPGAAAVIALGCALQPLLGAWLLSRKKAFDTSLSSLREFFRLCWLGGVLSPAVNAPLRAAGLLLAGSIGHGAYWHEVAHCWMACTLGIIVATSLVLIWRRLPRRPWRLAEAALLAIVSVLIGQVVFLDWFHDLLGSYGRSYWMYLLIAWAAVRLGVHGVLLLVTTAIVQMFIGVALGKGLFADDLLATHLLNAWVFTLTLALVGISLAIAFAERERAESDLRKLSLAVEQSPATIVITDLAGRIEYVNPAFASASGYAATEAIGRNPRILKSGHTRPEVYEELWRTLESGEVWRGEFTNRRKDGSIYVETVTISPLRQPDGSVSHYVGVKTDITELKQAMARIEESESRLQLAKSAAGLAIFDRDMMNGTYSWDERAREFWGVGPDEPISFATFMAGVHPEDRGIPLAALDRALHPRGDGRYAAEYRVVNRKDGGTRHISATGQVLFEKGRAVRIVGTMKDVTAEKRLQQELLERRGEMEQLVKQQVAAQTAAAIAHELNQPLVSVSAYSEAALRMLDTGAKQPEKLRRALEGAMEQAHRAGHTLHELLDFLRYGDDKAEPVDVNRLVHESLEIAKESGYGGFRPVLELGTGLPEVAANRLQLQKVFVNLLHNSIDAMREAGVPAGRATIRIRTARDGDSIRVTVQDSGPGLEGETASHAFDPFFTTKPNGVGLGLAISRALVKAHGGQLWADAGSGSGAVFHFTIPVPT